MILFLDFDGVLHPEGAVIEEVPAGWGTLRRPKLEGATLFEWAPQHEAVLAGFSDVEIVLSTRWVYWFGLSYARNCLPDAIAERVIGATWLGPEKMPLGWVYMPRHEQVLLHVRRELGDCEDWVALDDNPEWIEAPGHHHHFVVADPTTGISSPATQEALRALIAGLRARGEGK